MANPKYAGLPGIAPPDEKDVYETDDLPEADQEPEFSEEESESIERPHLNIQAAHSKFKDKTLICGKNVDFSDKYRRKRHTGYQALSGEWEIACDGEPETIFQRCNRLQCEFKELMEDISKLKENKNEEKSEMLEAIEPLIPQLQQSMHQLNSHLSDSGTNEFIKFMSGPQETQIKSLLTKLEELKEIGSSEKKTVDSGRKDNDSVITYRLQTFPSHNKFVQASRLSNLEHRINKLETVVGHSPENLNRLSLSEFSSLSQAVIEINARVSLLDAAQVDKIDGKLGALLGKMDNLVEKRGGSEMVDKEKKVNELYDSLAKTEALNHSIKPIMERLLALKSLHMEAGEFRKLLKELKSDQIDAANTIADNQATLKSVKESLESNLQVITKNIKAFEDRLTALKK